MCDRVRKARTYRAQSCLQARKRRTLSLTCLPSRSLHLFKFDRSSVLRFCPPALALLSFPLPLVAARLDVTGCLAARVDDTGCHKVAGMLMSVVGVSNSLVEGGVSTSRHAGGRRAPYSTLPAVRKAPTRPSSLLVSGRCVPRRAQLLLQFPVRQ